MGSKGVLVVVLSSIADFELVNFFLFNLYTKIFTNIVFCLFFIINYLIPKKL